MRRVWPLLVLLALAGAGVETAATWATRSAKSPTAVRVIARDFSFSLSRKTVPAGRVRFTVVNRGRTAHDFWIAGKKTPLLRPGRSAVLVVALTRPGSYPYRCTVPGHAALGMKGALRVVGKPAAQPATTTAQTAPPPPPVTPTTTSPSASVQLTKIGDFQRPVLVTAPLGDPSRVFVVEQRGTIQELVDGHVQPAPFLDLTDRVKEVSERGMLSAVFAPDYAQTGRFYVDYTDTAGNGNVNVVEYRRSAANPDIADAGSARPILHVDKPWENHNAGMMQFGPDGDLYVSVGDGDSGVLHPPGAFAQTLDDLLGNILRIDPRQTAGGQPYSVPDSNPFVGRQGDRGEVWDYGLRNPWRFWIDPATGDMYIGDAGEGNAEEIDYVQGNAGGRNFGWPCFEGNLTHASGSPCPGAVPPVYDYDHGGGRCAVIGGVVVHDPRLPLLEGRYLFGDLCDGRIHSMLVAEGSATEIRDLGIVVPNLDSFGVDGRGRVYVTSTDGGAYRLDPG